MTLTADPSPLRLWATVLLCGVGALVCVAPTLLVLASFAGLVRFDLNMLFVALPVLAGAVALALFGRAALRDLLLPRPVLRVGDGGLLDRRVMTDELEWSDVVRATSILDGGGGVVLELRRPIAAFGMGTLRYEQPEPDVAHIQVRGMTEPAVTIARAILDQAARAGAETSEARAHERVPRRSWSV